MMGNEDIEGQGILFSTEGPVVGVESPQTYRGQVLQERLGNSGNNSGSIPSAGRTRNFDYDLFGKLVRQDPDMQPENPGVWIATKRRILRKCGYGQLKGSGGEMVTMESAKDSRVGLTFRNQYRAYQRRLRRT